MSDNCENDIECWSCGASITLDKYVCDSCYRDPDTNNCVKCGKHLIGVCYAYVCGTCIEEEAKT